ncbi:MAG: TetR/AcrR family transcriptional regulator [Rhodobacteraceae bacterium]|nr:TetR/AcrR family transcriptional regulator [Paracoccaceae bacterium]
MTDGDAQLDRGWRGTRSGWIAGAYEVFLQGGVEAVKIQPLARKLRLSRTSFYWHFEDRDALLDALIALWQTKNTGNLIRQTELPAESISAAVLNIFDCWMSPDLFDPRFDYAMRGWGRSDPRVRARIVEADRDRLDAIREMFERHGFDRQEADIRASTLYLTQVGYFEVEPSEPLEKRLKHAPTYVETFAGRRPSAAEYAAFLARQRRWREKPGAAG